MKDLNGKKAVVTGGAMGIGFDTCLRLVKEGCSVTIWDLNEKALSEAKDKLEAAGGQVYLYPCDITNKEKVFELAEQAKSDMLRTFRQVTRKV